MEQEHLARVRRLQERINDALREDVEARKRSNFSEYIPDASTPQTRLLLQAAQNKGIEGLEAALDEFERLREHEDLPRLQHALMVFLSQHPAAAELGLRIPPLAERSPSLIVPSKGEE
jgi:uncharacterized Zn finger protein